MYCHKRNTPGGSFFQKIRKHIFSGRSNISLVNFAIFTIKTAGRADVWNRVRIGCRWKSYSSEAATNDLNDIVVGVSKNKSRVANKGTFAYWS